MEIDGQSPVWFVYADESGISVHDPILVVAGVIIHADSQWIVTEQRIRELIDKYVPEADRPRDFVFHATDLFHGSGVFKDLQKYPRERRIQALKDILSIPSQIRLPVVFGWTRKEQTSDRSNKERRADVAFEHAHALSMCVIKAESFMRTFAAPFEVATLTVEDNTETKTTVKLMHDAFRGVGHPARAEWAQQYSLDIENAEFIPLRRIVDGVHFVGKSGGFLLQLADACAWIIRRYLQENTGMEELLSAFVPRGPHAIIEGLDNIRSHFAGGGSVRCWELRTNE